MHIGQVIKAIRKTKGFTIAELSERSKVPKRTIERVEKVGRPTLETLLAITSGLGTTLENILEAAGLLRTMNPSEELTPITKVAIEADDTLSDEKKKLMLSLYAQLSSDAD